MALAFTSTQAPSKVDIDWALGIGRYWGMVMKGRVGWELGVGLVEVPRGRLDRKARSEKARWKAARIGVRSRRRHHEPGRSLVRRHGNGRPEEAYRRSHHCARLSDPFVAAEGQGRVSRLQSIRIALPT